MKSKKQKPKTQATLSNRHCLFRFILGAAPNGAQGSSVAPSRVWGTLWGLLGIKPGCCPVALAPHKGIFEKTKRGAWSGGIRLAHGGSTP